MNNSIFNCIPGNTYRLPNNPSMNPIISLLILENLSHNSIKTKCTICGDINTYSKNQLQNGKVYLCKNCGKKSMYKKKYVHLTVDNIKEYDNGIFAVCTCQDCGATENYNVDSLYAGKVYRCKKCLSGLRKGKRVQEYTIDKISVIKESSKFVAHIRCDKCNNIVLDIDALKLLDILDNKSKISNIVSCNCIPKIKAVSRVEKTSVQPSKETIKTSTNIKVPKETDNYTDIKLKDNDPNKVLATCRNCGIRQQYSLARILDDDVCTICRGLVEGDSIAYKKITDTEIEKAKLTEKGTNNIIKMKKRYELNVTNTKLIKNDFLRAKQTGAKYTPAIFCKCNNCNVEYKYSGKILDSDISKCIACDFEILLQSTIGNKINNTERIIESIVYLNNNTYIDTRCTSCGTVLKENKSSIKNKSLSRCPICEFNKSNKADKEIVGHIFGIKEIEKVNEYTKVGKYLILSIKRANTDSKVTVALRYNIKARCCDCGKLIDGNFYGIQDFKDTYESGRCDRCSSLESSVKNYINNNNWAGYIKNCRIIESVFTEDNLKKANIKCLLCGEKKVIPLTIFLNSDSVVCDNCRDNVIMMRCPSCNNIHDIKLTLGDIYNDNDNLDNDIIFKSKLLCPVTGVTSKLSLYRVYQEEQSRIDFLKNNYKELGDLSEVGGNADLVMSTEKYYIGTDNEKYFTCYCKKHNKFLTLREDEAIVYNHLYCADTRMYGYM